MSQEHEMPDLVKEDPAQTVPPTPIIMGRESETDSALDDTDEK